jgi:hypothetical protein
VSLISTLIRVRITLRVEIILVRDEIVRVVITFVRKLHSACENYTLRVVITHCVWKLHSACINHVCVIFTLIRVKITLVCVEIIL